jgi:hypothetical protein
MVVRIGPRAEPLDLIEIRRQLTALRSRHSDNPHITALLNDLLVKLVFLIEPQDRAHEQRLRAAILRTFETVERIASQSSPEASSKRLLNNPGRRISDDSR